MTQPFIKLKNVFALKKTTLERGELLLISEKEYNRFSEVDKELIQSVTLDEVKRGNVLNTETRETEHYLYELPVCYLLYIPESIEFCGGVYNIKFKRGIPQRLYDAETGETLLRCPSKTVADTLLVKDIEGVFLYNGRPCSRADVLLDNIITNSYTEREFDKMLSARLKKHLYNTEEHEHRDEEEKLFRRMNLGGDDIKKYKLVSPRYELNKSSKMAMSDGRISFSTDVNITKSHAYNYVGVLSKIYDDLIIRHAIERQLNGNSTYMDILNKADVEYFAVQSKFEYINNLSAFNELMQAGCRVNVGDDYYVKSRCQYSKMPFIKLSYSFRPYIDEKYSLFD